MRDTGWQGKWIHGYGIWADALALPKPVVPGPMNVQEDGAAPKPTLFVVENGRVRALMRDRRAGFNPKPKETP